MILIIYGILLLVLATYKLRFNDNKPIQDNKNHNFAVLIPARDESKVIEGILKSIKNQTFNINMNNVYVIVESKLDKTVDICKNYDANVLFRTNLNHKRKGYALDEAIKQINKKYDAYFIFDADNILDKNYFKEMIKTYDLGYDIGVGYRNCKNGNDSVVSAVSSLTFSMINTLGNDNRNKWHADIVVSGTGFYIRGNFIEKWHGYPFNSLTEDYELSLYASLNSMTSYYNNKAIFYDEQPVKYRQTINQRVRWIKGYFTSRKKYIPLIKKQLNKNNKNYGSQYNTCIGVKPYIYIVIGLILCVIKLLLKIIVGKRKLVILKILLFLVLAIYLILIFATIIMLKKDKLNINNKMKIKAILYNPIYLLTYIPCAIKALICKDVVWKKVEHNVNIN